MDDILYPCVDCGRLWPEDRFNRANLHPESCFSCRSRGVSLALQGGKEYWNEDTERRRSDRAIAEAKAAGFDPVPVHTAGNALSASSLKKTEATAKVVPMFGSKVAAPRTTANSGAVTGG